MHVVETLPQSKHVSVSEICGLVLTLKKVLDSMPIVRDEKVDFAGWDVRPKHISVKVLASSLWHELGQ